MGGGTGEKNRWKASVPAGWAVQEKEKAALLSLFWRSEEDESRR